MAENPFFAPSDLPYQLPPFERIREEHYLPAFERGMAEQLAEVEAIASADEEPTFENTIVALERSGRLLDRVSAVFFNKTSADTDPGIQRIQQEITPRLARHSDAIHLNRALFARIKRLYEARDELGLAPDELRLLERYHTDFVRAGAELDDACARLDHVISVTEQATHRTLDLADECRALVEGLRAEGVSVGQDQVLDRIRANLTEIALTQSYQDITGQIIKRVAGIVRRMHEGFGELGLAQEGRPAEPALAGPAVAGLDRHAVSQDDADALLAGLGL